LDHKKPYFFMHEADEDRGGMPLDVLRKDWASVRPEVTLFSDSTPTITWHRVQDYQLMSLRMTAELMIHEMPSYSNFKQPPKLFLRGNILSKSFSFKVKPAVYVSANNPGAMEMADELHGKYGAAGLTISRQMPPEFAAYDTSNNSRRKMRHLLITRLGRRGVCCCPLLPRQRAPTCFSTSAKKPSSVMLGDASRMRSVRRTG